MKTLLAGQIRMLEKLLEHTGQGPGASDQSVFDHLREGCQIIGPDHRYVYVNAAAAQQGRSSPEALVGRRMQDAYPGIEETEVFAHIRTCLEEGLPAQMENEFRFADGTRGWFDLRIEPVPHGAFVLSIDITDRKRAESDLRSSNRALRTLSECNQALVRATDERAFVDELCQVIVQHGGQHTACVGLGERPTAGALPLVAHASRPESGASSTASDPAVVWGESARPGGPLEAAMLSLAPAVVRLDGDRPGGGEACGEATGFAFTAMVAFPLLHDAELLGALAIYSDSPDGFGADELALLAELAMDLGHGIGTIRARRLHEAVEQTERQSRQEHARLLGHLPGMAYRCRNDPSWTMEVVSEGCRALTGLTPEQLMQSEPYAYADLIHPDDRQRVWELVQGAVAEGRPFLAEYRIQDVRGRERWVWERGAPAPAEGDGAPALEGFIMDVTARVEARRSLEESEARARALHEYLPVPTLEWRLRGAHDFRLVGLNRRAREVTSDALGALVGASAGLFETALPGLGEDLARCLEDRDSVRRETVGQLPGMATARRLVLTYGFLPDDGVILHLEDVTEQRALEEQLRVTQRLEAVGSLAGGVAHDFNNLLMVMLGNLAFAMREVGPRGPVTECLEQAQHAGERAAELTHQLLAFGRTQQLHPEPVSLNALIRDLESLIRRLVGEHIEVDVRATPDLGHVEVDRVQIEQVIMNLAVNARDAMPRGGRLTIETLNLARVEGDADVHRRLASGAYVLLRVTDTGIGMDAATRARIFDPFFTTKEAGQGTGLGLATVYGIVEQSGGVTRVQSEPGRGAIFEVYLPRTEAVAAPPPTMHPSRVPERGSECVLLVEDEEGVRKLVERVLREAGYEVLSASDGTEALHLAEHRSGPIDLLVTDVVMPGTDGPEVAERLVRSHPALRVLYMSGYAGDALDHYGIDSTEARPLSKPFKADELLARVRALLDRTGGGAVRAS